VPGWSEKHATPWAVLLSAIAMTLLILPAFALASIIDPVSSIPGFPPFLHQAARNPFSRVG